MAKSKVLRQAAAAKQAKPSKKTIAKIVFTCSNDGQKRTGNETATVSFNGSEAEYNNVFTGTSGGGVQLRITNIVVTYAK